MSEVSIFKKRTRNSVVGKAQLFHKVEGREDAEAMGQYEGNNWLDTGEDMCPEFNAEENAWFFDGDTEDIKKLLKEVNLNHEFGPKVGKRILFEDVNLYNPADPLFNHSVFKRMTEKSKLRIDHSKPLDNFLYLCLIALEDTLRPDEDNPAVSADTRYEVVQAGSDEKKQAKSLSDKLEATARLHAMDRTKMLQVARALNHPLFFPPKGISEDSLRSTLYLRVIEEGKDMKDSDGKTFISKFIELSDLTKKELEIQEIVGFAIKRGIVSPRRDGNYHLFKGGDETEILEGIHSEKDLIDELKIRGGYKLNDGGSLIALLRNKFKDENGE